MQDKTHKNIRKQNMLHASCWKDYELGNNQGKSQTLENEEETKYYQGYI